MFSKHETFRLAHLNLTGGCNLPQVGIVGEGDVVGGVPVQAVAVHVEGDGVYQVVDGLHHLLAALPGGAVDDGQTAAEVINF